VTDRKSYFDTRRAGVCLHVTSLPGSQGIGELGAPALRFLDWMAAHGLSVWQFLPLGPTGFGNSPYLPLSVFAGNPLLINMALLADWGLLDRDEAASRYDGEDHRIDFAFASAAKSEWLAVAATRFLERPDSGLAAEFEAFCAQNDAVWLDAYAAFTVLKAQHGGRAWTEWQSTRGLAAHSTAGRRAESTARTVAESAAQVAHEQADAWQRAKCIQFFFARQWTSLRAAARERGIRLFGDVPIYMGLDCAEAWAHPELLALDASGVPTEVSGVPPDYFSDDGQLWGTPVYRWDVHAADGFSWWIARLRQALALADFVRLDHFRGFDAFWSVPYGATTAREGRWVQGPGRALFDALTRAFGRAPFVAEDLGIITESVTELRKAYALPGMQVLQFLVDRLDFDRDAIDEDCVCYTGTHDNDTTEGWFAGSRGHMAGKALKTFQGTVRQNTEKFSGSIHKAMISLCFSTRAQLAIVPMQDYLGLGSAARLNTPGEPDGNWCWRATDADLERDNLSYIDELVTRTGRA
jgi:4-alpha-glucanotransferase